MAASACSDEADPTPYTPPAVIADSGTGAPPATQNPNPPITSNPNPIVTSDAGGTPPAVMDAGVVVDSGAPIVAADAATDTGNTSSATPCTGKLGMRKGKSNQTLMAGGLKRSFIYYAPQGLDPNTPVPLLIIPHGTNMSGAGMFDLTQYAKIADREKFIAIFPDGEDGPGSLVPWNVGQNICGLGAFVGASGNDQAFVDELIKFAQDDQCIDEEHVFMTGFSMGGYFSNESGCMNPKIKGIGPHSGGTHPFTNCVNKHRPAIVFHFKTDSLIDYACGTGARDNWIKLNGCTAADPEVVTVKGGKCEYYKGCPADGQVAMCSFDGGDIALPPGHAWSGGANMGENSFAASPDTESSSELGWAFFKKYAW